MDWLVVIVAVIAAVMIGVILYRMDKKNSKEQKDHKAKGSKQDGC